MSTLLVWKDQLQNIYARYSAYIEKVLQFILGLFVFGLINSNVGFMKAASSGFITVGLAAVCAFLPLVVMVIAATLLILLHFYALSPAIMLVTLMVFLIMYVFYFRFTPNRAWLVLLTPIAFWLKIPFVIPVAFGLLGTPICVLPAVFGTVVYYMAHVVKTSSSAFKGTGTKGIVGAFVNFTKQAMSNKEMWVMAAAVAVGLLLVYAIRTRSVAHAWKIGNASGVIGAIVVDAVGNVALNVHISYGYMVISGIAAIAVGLVLEFLFFTVDYSRTEHLQFEDDEYYYYVKAVPKLGVVVPEMSVKHINERQESVDSQETVLIDSAEIEKAMGGKIPEAQKTPGVRKAAEGNRSSNQQKTPENRNSVEKRNQDRQPVRTQGPDDILLTRSLNRELGLDQPEDKRK